MKKYVPLFEEFLNDPERELDKEEPSNLEEDVANSQDVSDPQTTPYDPNQTKPLAPNDTDYDPDSEAIVH